MGKAELKIEFDNEAAAKHFAFWLCESGEDGYQEWMECREQEEPEGDITALCFHYHGDPEKKTKRKQPPFMPDNVIRTTCGRQDER